MAVAMMPYGNTPHSRPLYSHKNAQTYSQTSEPILDFPEMEPKFKTYTIVNVCTLY